VCYHCQIVTFQSTFHPPLASTLLTFTLTDLNATPLTLFPNMPFTIPTPNTPAPLPSLHSGPLVT